MESKIKTVFFGSGAFAVPVLEALCLNRKIEMCGIITQPDKPAGRKMTLTPTPVGKWCDAHGIECRRVKSVNAPDFMEEMQGRMADLIVVVSFGQILKEAVLALPKFCCLNVHASILPKYRGASPITSVVLHGEKETGVTFMDMDKGLDTGAVFEIHKYTLPQGITTDLLEQKLSGLAAQKIVACMENIVERHLASIPQNHNEATVSRKIKKNDGSMKWNESALTIERKIRAFHPWPSVCFCFPSQNRCVNVKITSGRSIQAVSAAPPGTILHLSKEGITVSCGLGAILLERVIPEGKKEMSAADFARGFRLTSGEVFDDGPDFLSKTK